MQVFCGGFGDLSGWFLTLEIASSSILKPDLLKKRIVVMFMEHSIIQITHGKSVKQMSYLNFRLWQSSCRGKGLLHFNVRVLCDREGSLQLAQLLLAESSALPAALGVRARPVGSIMMHYRERKTYSYSFALLTST